MLLDEVAKADSAPYPPKDLSLDSPFHKPSRAPREVTSLQNPYRVIEPPSSTGAANCSTHRLRYTRTVRVFFKPNNLLP